MDIKVDITNQLSPTKHSLISLEKKKMSGKTLVFLLLVFLFLAYFPDTISSSRNLKRATDYSKKLLQDRQSLPSAPPQDGRRGGYHGPSAGFNMICRSCIYKEGTK